MVASRCVLALLLASTVMVAQGRESSLPPHSPSSVKYPIVPGVGVGPFKVGMPIPEALKVLGAPDEVLGYVGTASYRYKSLTIDADGGVPMEKQVVRSVNTTSSVFKTYSGLAVGSLELQVRALMGEPTCTTTMGEHVVLAYAQGVSFILDRRTRQVTEIAVRSSFC